MLNLFLNLSKICAYIFHLNYSKFAPCNDCISGKEEYEIEQRIT